MTKIDNFIYLIPNVGCYQLLGIIIVGLLWLMKLNNIQDLHLVSDLWGAGILIDPHRPFASVQ